MEVWTGDLLPLLSLGWPCVFLISNTTLFTYQVLRLAVADDDGILGRHVIIPPRAEMVDPQLICLPVTVTKAEEGVLRFEWQAKCVLHRVAQLLERDQLFPVPLLELVDPEPSDIAEKLVLDIRWNGLAKLVLEVKAKSRGFVVRYTSRLSSHSQREPWFATPVLQEQIVKLFRLKRDTRCLACQNLLHDGIDLGISRVNLLTKTFQNVENAPENVMNCEWIADWEEVRTPGRPHGLVVRCFWSEM